MSAEDVFVRDFNVDLCSVLMLKVSSWPALVIDHVDRSLPLPSQQDYSLVPEMTLGRDEHDCAYLSLKKLYLLKQQRGK